MATNYKKNIRKPNADKKSGREIRNEMLENITRQMIQLMEDGTLPWTKGRADALGASMPTNLLTGKRYKGINAINLMLVGLKNGFNANYYGTFNQAMKNADLKADDPDIMNKKPLAGQKSCAKVINAQFKWIDPKDKDRKKWSVFDKKEGKRRYEPTKAEVEKFGLQKVFSHHQAYSVFAYEQLQYVSPKQEQLCNMTPKVINPELEQAQSDAKTKAVVEALQAKLGIEVEHSAAFETPAYAQMGTSEKIQMPPIEMYESNNRYYHSLLHEMVHATGHASRLDRDSLKDYHKDPKDRAYEELVAELGGVFLGMELGIRMPSSSEMGNHAAYLKGWHQLLSDDVSEGKYDTFNKAAQEAERAVSFLVKDLELTLENTVKVPQAKKQPEYEDSTMEP